MKDIVIIRFRYKGAVYIGKLKKVSGMEYIPSYHLDVDSYIWGRLTKIDNKWRFIPTEYTQGLEILSEWMGSKVDV